MLILNYILFAISIALCIWHFKRYLNGNSCNILDCSYFSPTLAYYLFINFLIKYIKN
jgi:hypothetical protein